jgi:hypothetical protein
MHSFNACRGNSKKGFEHESKKKKKKKMKTPKRETKIEMGTTEGRKLRRSCGKTDRWRGLGVR